MTPIESLAAALDTVGITPLYLMEGAPDAENTAISLTPYMGAPISADQALIGDEQSVQAYIRGDRYAEGYELAWKAYRAVCALMEQQESFEDYRIAGVMQSPTYIGRDEKRRYLLSFNFRMRRF